MQCATVSCAMDDETVTMLQDKTVTAAKDHRCYECRRAIVKGEKYRTEVTVLDGQIERYKTCLDCISIRDEFFKRGWYWQAIKEMLWEHIMDCQGEISESSVKSLTPRAREMVCEIIEEAWERYREDE